MATYKLLLLPGDGIGPEVMAEAERVVAWVNRTGVASIETETDLVGGSAYDAHGQAISNATMERALAADAVMLAAVGGPKWDGVPYEQRPEAGLLRLRKDLGLFANLRPAICYPALADASSLKRDRVDGLDIMIVRELTGGVYFGEPKTITDLGNGQKRAIDTQVYETYEIERIASVAFDLARERKRLVHSAEKRNVMKTGVLWNEVVTKIHKERYGDVTLHHILADNCAMQLVRAPKQFDVIVTDNLFGDMLSDEAAMLTGSLGMLPSASLGPADERGHRRALYEPVHGSAPDIAGQGVANPIATIASLAMCLRYSFFLGDTADRIDAGHRPRARPGSPHRRYQAGRLPHRRLARDGRGHRQGARCVSAAGQPLLPRTVFGRPQDGIEAKMKRSLSLIACRPCHPRSGRACARSRGWDRRKETPKPPVKRRRRRPRPADAKRKLTPEETAEKEARKDCKKKICDIVATRDPNGENVSCDIVKTWREEDIVKMLGGQIGWPWGKAVCQSKLELERKPLALAMSEASHEIVMPVQKVRCTLAQKSRRRALYDRGDGCAQG